MLGRSWRVRFNNRTAISVMTNVVHITPSEQTRLQQDQGFSPSRWLKYNSNDTVMDDLFNWQEYLDTYWEIQQETFINKRLGDSC